MERLDCIMIHILLVGLVLCISYVKLKEINSNLIEINNTLNLNRAINDMQKQETEKVIKQEPVNGQT